MKCVKCGFENSENSKFCNECGTLLQQEQQTTSPDVTEHPAPSAQKVKKPFYKRWWFIVIVVLLVLAIIGGAFSDDGDEVTDTAKEQPSIASQASKEEAKKPEPEPEPEPETVKIAATDLVAAYEENEVKADSLYKGEYLEVKGIVDTIGKDIANRVYVTLGSGEVFEWNVQCFFKSEDEIQKAAELTSGDAITIIGKCDGYLLNVILKDCEIVE